MQAVVYSLHGHWPARPECFATCLAQEPWTLARWRLSDITSAGQERKKQTSWFFDIKAPSDFISTNTRFQRKHGALSHLKMAPQRRQVVSCCRSLIYHLVVHNSFYVVTVMVVALKAHSGWFVLFFITLRAESSTTFIIFNDNSRYLSAVFTVRRLSSSK